MHIPYCHKIKCPIYSQASAVTRGASFDARSKEPGRDSPCIALAEGFNITTLLPYLTFAFIRVQIRMNYS